MTDSDSNPEPWGRELEASLTAFEQACARKGSRTTCLRLWSRFIRARDGYRCVLCQSNRHVNAHHIARKCAISIAEFDTGNGISLCRECHRQIHAAWNGRPRPNEPLNARDGDDQDVMAELFHALYESAKACGLDIDRYYRLSDSVLNLFKSYQGFSHDVEFQGPRIRQAHVIWAGAPVQWYRKLAGLVREALDIEDPQDSLDHITRGLSPKIH